MSFGLFLCLLALAHTSSCLLFDAASSSYAKYRDWTTPSSGDLVFYFKTNKPNGLLLYKDEKNFEFLDVSLTDGRVRLRLAMFECSRRKALVESNLADSKWHYVRINFNNEKTSIIVDETWSAFVNCSSEAPKGFTKLTGGMFVGGLPKEIDLQSLAFPSSFYEFFDEKRFDGCISGVRYTEEPGGTFRRAKLNTSRGTERGCTDPCSKCERNGKCIYQQKTYRCNCGGTGYEEPFCRQESPSVEMRGSSYILYNMTKDLQDLSFTSRYVAVRLRTRSPDGLVLQTGGLTDRNKKDFLMVELKGGSILVKMDHGGGEIRLTGGYGSLHDGGWHWIVVRRHKHDVSLIIDNKVTSSKKVPGKFLILNFEKENAKMYIGGGPKEELTKSVAKKNFSGILQQFRFDKIKVFVRAQSDNHSVFRNFGAVIMATLPTTSTQSITRPVSSPEGNGCEDDDNQCVSVSENTSVPSTQRSNAAVKTKTGDQLPKQNPTESGDFPIWPLSLIVIVTAITAVLVTIFLVLRWHRWYAGSYVPERTTQ